MQQPMQSMPMHPQQVYGMTPPHHPEHLQPLPMPAMPGASYLHASSGSPQMPPPQISVPLMFSSPPMQPYQQHSVYEAKSPVERSPQVQTLQHANSTPQRAQLQVSAMPFVKSQSTVSGGSTVSQEEKKLYEQAFLMAKDQGGCRLLQKRIEERDKDTFDLIYANILPHFVDLMNDPFGNYLC